MSDTTYDIWSLPDCTKKTQQLGHPQRCRLLFEDEQRRHPFKGGAPHRLSCAVASRNEIDIDHLRSRRFAAADFDRFDRIVVMDEMNMRDVLARARSQRDREKVSLLRGADGDVADPIFGGEDEYERAFAEIDEACERLLDDMRAELGA